MHTEQNQIINLTARYPYYKELSGCIQTPIIPSTGRPYYTISVPTAPTKKRFTTTPRHVTKPPTHLTTLNHVTTVSQVTTFSHDYTMEKYYISSTINDISTLPYETSSITAATTKATIEDFSLKTTEKDLSMDFEEVDSNRVTSFSRIKRAILNQQKQETKNKRIICRNARRFRSSRERWWFVAVSNCNATKVNLIFFSSSTIS